MILAGDIGGTKCNLALFQEVEGELHPIFQSRYATHDFSRFQDLVELFRKDAAGRVADAVSPRVTAAGFGVAGAVVDGHLHANNLPWDLTSAGLAGMLNVDPANIVLLNDVVATAWSLDKLPGKDLAVLNQGVAQPNGTKALMAVGTGLGETFLFWDGQQYRIFPSEGGLASFAPRTPREIQLLIHLQQRLSHVCCEDVLSGRGIVAIHEFLDPDARHASFEGSGVDPAREITEQACAATCPVCVTTMDLWTEAYGSEAGNLAIRALAFGGVYVAGGIAPKILSKMQDGAFFRAFCDKTMLGPVLARIPIYVVLNENAPMWGAAYQAMAAAHPGATTTSANSDGPKLGNFYAESSTSKVHS